MDLKELVVYYGLIIICLATLLMCSLSINLQGSIYLSLNDMSFIIFVMVYDSLWLKDNLIYNAYNDYLFDSWWFLVHLCKENNLSLPVKPQSYFQERIEIGNTLTLVLPDIPNNTYISGLVLTEESMIV